MGAFLLGSLFWLVIRLGKFYPAVQCLWVDVLLAKFANGLIQLFALVRAQIFYIQKRVRHIRKMDELGWRACGL